MQRNLCPVLVVLTLTGLVYVDRLPADEVPPGPGSVKHYGHFGPEIANTMSEIDFLRGEYPPYGGVADGGFCDDCDCCSSSCRPVFEARVNTVVLRREEPNELRLLSGPGGESLLDASQFDFRWEFGVDSMLTYQANECVGIEGGWTWVEDWQSRVNFSIPAGVSQYQTTPPTTFTGPALSMADYESEFQSGQANLRLTLLPSVTLLAGFRYARLHEDLTVLSMAASTQRDAWRTKNDLYGFQVGTDACLASTCWGFSFDVTAKAGIYSNDAELQFETAVDNALMAVANDGEQKAAFVGELTLRASYWVTCNLATFVGYQAVWLEGVTLAPDQIAGTGNFNTAGPTPIPATINMDGSVFLHGAQAGLILAY